MKNKKGSNQYNKKFNWDAFSDHVIRIVLAPLAFVSLLASGYDIIKFFIS